MPDSDILIREIEPVIKDLANGINDIVSQLKNLQHPLSESKEKVPKATEQLDKISEQTELATHEMLDTVEKITEREQMIGDGLKELKADLTAGKAADIEAKIDKLSAMSEESCNDAFSIMNVLQFQDITSQQIDQAAVLLEEIEVKLHQIIEILPGGEGIGTQEAAAAGRKVRSFDPHADLTDKKTQQEDIDSLFAQKRDD